MVQREIESNKIEVLKESVLKILSKHKCNTVNEVINILSANKDIKLEDLYKAIKELEEDGKLELYDPNVRSFIHYITDITSSGPLWFVLGVTSLVLSSIYLLPQEHPWTILRAFVGGLFVLFIPGYSLIHLLFKKRFDIIEKAAFSTGLSLAITSLLGFILNYSIGIWLEPAIVLLSLTSISLIIIAAYRKFFELSKLEDR